MFVTVWFGEILKKETTKNTRYKENLEDPMSATFLLKKKTFKLQ